MKFVKTACVLTMFAITLGCGYSSKMNPPVAGTTPTIAQLNPDNANHGGGGFNMIINGTNFASKAVVNWNGAAQATTFVSGNQLTIAVAASLIANSGTAQITVTNPGTSGGTYGGGTLPETSAPMVFTVN